MTRKTYSIGIGRPLFFFLENTCRLIDRDEQMSWYLHDFGLGVLLWFG